MTPPNTPATTASKKEWTKTPWKVESGRAPTITNCDGRIIGELYGRDTSSVEDEANAKRIVQAVNNFDALVKALEDMVDQAQERYPHCECERGQAYIKAARAALNRCKEGL